MGADRRLVAGSWTRVELVLGRAVWTVFGLGVLVGVLVEFVDLTRVRQELVVLFLGVFFALVVARVAAAALAFPSRRTALVSLAVGLCFWAAGSAIVLNSGDPLAATRFPSPGELLFLTSYLGIATFLLLDVAGRRSHAGTIWLETAVVCGGAACVAGLLLMPVAAQFAAAGTDGTAVLVALLYPVIDLLLATIVVGQAVLRLREVSRPTVFLGAGFVALAVADSSLALNLNNATYVSNVVIDMLYGAAFALVSAGACARRPDLAVLQERRQRAGVLMGAASIALIALAVRPTGVTAWYITVPAVVTLVAAGYRLVLALRDAQGAADALRLSRTDELTGLPNRRAVLQDLDTAMQDGRPLALMLLDLDGFKDINDSLGHAAGDAVLGVAADRVRRFVSPGVSVARLGGDEFAVMVRDADPLALLEMAQRLRDDLLEPVRVEGLELAIRASIGITVKGEGDARATDLLRRSDVAMFEAKASRAGTLLYDASRDGFSRQRLRLAEDLRRGIAEDQLVVWYQPQVDAVTHEVSGVEALVRWQHPTEGLLLPLHFLPDARRSGLMLALSEAVAHQVVGDARRWLDSGFSFRVSMNCAPPELLGGSLLPRLFDALENARLPAESLLVEVTEDSFLSDPERAREHLLDIRAHGVQVAIDDYGTGFSSLAYLRDLPVQELKMDRSFVSTILTDRRSRVIVDSTKQMAHAMGLRVVAEGVEDSQTAAELMGMGIDVLQGHHVSPPMAASEIGPWMRRWSAGLTRARAGQGVGQLG